MALVVKKFGGTSVGDLKRIRHVAQLVRAHKERTGDDVVVVVSAMSGETNKLVELAHDCVKKPAPREMDVLLATGEQVTIALLSMALIEQGTPARSVLASQARIATDGRHTEAHIEKIDEEAFRPLLSEGITPVVAGFQGIDPSGDVTTLGRGGSDVSAVAIAAALNAKQCYIYTDVEGVYSADPRICKEAFRLPKICHEEMLEMASLGAKVLHPRSVYFAMRYQVPLTVLSTFEPGEGTQIVKEEELVEKPVVTGVTYRMDEAKVTVNGLRGGIGSLNKLFSVLSGGGLFVDMITQTGTFEDQTNVSFTVPDNESSQALEIVQEALSEIGADGASLDRNIAKVSVVGIGMRYHTGVAAKMFEVLAQEGIDVQMISTSEIKISVVIPRKYCEMAVRTLHDGFVEYKPEISEEQI